MRVPLDGEVTWLLPEGEEPYWRGHITEIVYEFARGSRGTTLKGASLSESACGRSRLPSSRLLGKGGSVGDKKSPGTSGAMSERRT